MVGALPPRSDSNIIMLSGGDSRSRDDDILMDTTSVSNAVIDDGKPAVCVGSRIRCDDSIGTVRYIGEVSGYNGVWYGIDWDQQDRGKHNGSVGGIRYFTASGPTSGSFIRENKIGPSVSCAYAIWKCYGEKEDENTAALCKAVIDDWKREIKVPFIEMVGFDSIRKKQSNLSRLIEACVSDMNVSHAGQLSQLCPSLRLLDLSKNLLPDWATVVDIARQLPHLERIDLRNNKLALPSSNEEAAQFASSFPKLHKLILTHCSLDWEQVKRISVMLPALREFILAFNDISRIDAALTDSMMNLTQLILDSNPLEEWSSIMNLSRIESLQVLCLNECRLKEIRFDETCNGEKTDCFKNLEVLHLKWNLISDWRSVSELDKLRKLEKLFLWKNPVTDVEDYDTCSQLIIARIGHLKELNGSEIVSAARRGAEYDYLKRHGKQWKALTHTTTTTETSCDSSNSNEEQIKQFLLMHSRFQYLIQKYGLPDDSLLENKKVTHIIRTKLIEIILKDEASGVTLTKKVPSTMIVQKLIALARRMFLAKYKGDGSSGSSNVTHSTEPSLYCLCTSKSDASQMTVQLENHLKELEYYSVSDGDTVIIKW